MSSFGLLVYFNWCKNEYFAKLMSISSVILKKLHTVKCFSCNSFKNRGTFKGVCFKCFLDLCKKVYKKTLKIIIDSKFYENVSNASLPKECKQFSWQIQEAGGLQKSLDQNCYGEQPAVMISRKYPMQEFLKQPLWSAI